jgi:hypothetical protein
MESNPKQGDMIVTYDLIIDPELRDHLESVSGMQQSMLEDALLAAGGPSDPITVWKGTKIIVDGHRRYGICERHGLPYKTREQEFADKQAVKDWMDEYQGSRRNQSGHAQALLFARRVEAVSRKLGAKHGAVHGAVKIVSEEQGVSERTVYRLKSYADAFQGLPKDIQDGLTSGRIPASQSDVCELAELPEVHQRAVVNLVLNGDFKHLGRAIRGEDAEVEESDIESVPTTDRLSEMPDTDEDLDEDEPVENLDSEPDEDEAEDFEPEEDEDEPEPDDDDDDVRSSSERAASVARPPHRPVSQVLDEVEKHLIKAAKLVDEIRRAGPARHKGLLTLFHQVSEQIEEWRTDGV